MRDTPHRRRRSDRWLWRAERAAFLVVIIACLGITYLAVDRLESDTDRRIQRNLAELQETQRKLAEVERKDADTARATAYRICQRHSVVDRAFAHWAVGAQAARRLERASGIPILDCKPNLRGMGAKLLSPAAQRQIVRRWLDGDLTNEELGICPDSVIGREGEAQNC